MVVAALAVQLEYELLAARDDSVAPSVTSTTRLWAGVVDVALCVQLK